MLPSVSNAAEQEHAATPSSLLPASPDSLFSSSVTSWHWLTCSSECPRRYASYRAISWRLDTSRRPTFLHPLSLSVSLCCSPPRPALTLGTCTDVPSQSLPNWPQRHARARSRLAGHSRQLPGHSGPLPSLALPTLLLCRSSASEPESDLCQTLALSPHYCPSGPYLHSLESSPLLLATPSSSSCPW